MTANFPRALRFVLAHECVFAPGHDGDLAHVVTENVPGDGGGLTKFGIDQASHPEVDIRALDLEAATQIYLEQYWTRARCDDLPAGYDAAVFDIAVNNGVRAAARMLQLALLVEVDGVIGPVTIDAAVLCGAAGLGRLLASRRKYYLAIAEARPSRRKFLKGWLDRNSELAALVLGDRSGEGIA